MAGTLSQTLHRLQIGRRKSIDARTDPLPLVVAEGCVPVVRLGEVPADSQVSDGSSELATPPPAPSRSVDMQTCEAEVKPTVEKKSSWLFSRSKNKKASSKEWPQEFVCPISKCLMADPVIVASGESYERQCIEIWLQQGNGHCFKTGVSLAHDSLTPNIALRSAIQTWCEKNKVAKPRGPTVESATELVESRAQTAFVSGDGSDPRSQEDPARPGWSNDSARPGFGTDSARPGFGTDEGLEGYNGSPRTSSHGNNEIYEEHSGISEKQWSNGGEGEPSDQMGPAWMKSQDQNMPLWTRRQYGHRTRLSSGGSRDSSMEFDRRNSSAEYYGSSTSIGNADANSSSEWPPAANMNRYVHSASAHALKEDTGPTRTRGRTPLPLETTPSSYLADEAGENHEGSGIETKLMNKLRHRHAIEQEEGAAEIRRLARNTEAGVDYRLTLCTPELLGALVPLLLSRYGGVQINAVAAIMNLSLAHENKVKIARAGAIPALIDLLKSRSDAAQEHAAGALFSLALNDENKMAIGVLGAIPPLIHVLRGESPGGQRDAAMALYHLSFATINRAKLIKAGAVPILLQVVQEESPDLVSRGLLILCNLAAVQEGRSAICEGHGIIVFVDLLSAGRETPSAQSSGPGMH